ncbi:DNA polymerase III subunit gamma/tau [Bifidobacterium sp. 64T4]|uniref:DNA polymerase III subunit gamma/tau n=1 Tax=Bifidobacterium pongonis TaxID=2834432 RepID=UPI001C575AB7|nr:DNA polymerase III subunit gamma/tau [Bifidobacterium pongonis]MBW3093793.1 DNA polymerase III subunit gamma/tau [Bifidobacterium pongonis]MBW3093918.1 DNA polymerase III subunit gamma/tau [Bifidobacterium pongonis]
MALALYRRYRPDTFEGVIGQEQVTVPLMRALDEGKLTHAYLFSGPRGCGKTSSARILARCVNCAKGPTSHPCGECESCKDLATGGPGSIDVVEIDAASHNGVDDARELRERAGFAPARDRYKIFILDEAHMVTPQGFNALLKIVEEPPEHVMFIFATTEPDKVIGTIRSRTHHYPFRLVPQEVMGPYLEQICEKEHIKPEPGVLRLAMRAGGGSMRDTLSVLDQLMIGSVDGVITHDASVALLGFTPEALIGQGIDAVIDGNGEALYDVVQKVVVGGFDPRRFVEDLLARVRDLMVLTLAGDRAESVLSDSAEGEDLSELRRQAEALGLNALTVMADTMNSTLANMTGAISPRMRLELLAARLLAERENGWVGHAASAGAPTVAQPAGASAGASGAAQHATPAGGHSGFAGASRNMKTSSSASAHGGFAGASRNQEHNQGNSQGNGQEQASSANAAQAKPASPQLDASGFAVTSNTANPAASTPQTQAETTQQAPAAPQTASPADDGRTPDEKWDVLVRDLPQDVRKYVSRDKVVRIKYAPQPSTGKMRLWLKFDKALSKYAFALGVAKETVDGTTKVVDIVRAEVRKAFGEHTEIAPTKLTDDGVRAPAFKQLPAEEQQRIKTQLLQENLKSATANTSQWGESAGESASRERSDASEASGAQGEAADDADAHRSLDGFAPERPVSLRQDSTSAANETVDGWAVPQTADSAQSESSAAAAPARQAAQEAEADDDPWAVPPQPHGQASGQVVPQQENAENSQPEEHRKHVAVPDLSDGIDPWATPATPPAAQAAQTTQAAQAASAANTGAQHQPSQSNQPNQANQSGRSNQQSAPSAADPSDDPWQMAGAPIPPPAEPMPEPEPGPEPMAPAEPDPWAMAAATPPTQPQVAADEDEYSMSDESLGAATAMSTDDIKRLFEVKKVEEFAADDPRNPRNAHQTTKHTEE